VEVLEALLLPSTVLPETVRVPVTVRVLLAVTAALKDATAFTVTVWLPPTLPRTVLPVTVSGPAVSQHTSHITLYSSAPSI